MTNAFAKLLAAAVLTAMLAPAASHGVELDPKAVVYQLPDQIKWGPVTPAGNQQAVLFGDPTKPGLYGVLTKWVAGNHFSKPHFHADIGALRGEVVRFRNASCQSHKLRSFRRGQFCFL
jgi:hypothetical protein